MRPYVRYILLSIGMLFASNMVIAADLFVSDCGSNSIYKITSDGTRCTFASGLNVPEGLAFDSSGNLYESDYGSGNIYKFTPDGTRSTFASGLNAPMGLVFDSNGNLYESDYGSGNIYKFTPDGTRSTFAGGVGVRPKCLAFDSSGNLIVSNNFPVFIYKFTPSGTKSIYAMSLSASPMGLAFDSNGNLFVSSASENVISEFTPSGSRSTIVSDLHHPVGLAFDNSGNLFVADYNDGKICKFTPDGTQSTFASGLTNPWGLAFAPIPEPSTLALLGMGGIGLMACGWRRKKSHRIVVCFIALLASTAGMVRADTFGTGANQFTLDFVPIPGATNPSSGKGIVNHDYRMGTYEITNNQWNKFKAEYGILAGNPSNAYSIDSYFTGENVPVNEVSWYEALQFVNWLNISTGHQAAYKFIGLQGTGDYTFDTWSSTDSGYDANNPYRNKNAYYFLPTEDEWIKAAYWNGMTLQTFATKSGESVTQGNGSSGMGWNYSNPAGPWDAGSGSQELNGTYDMMGNVTEWTESCSSDYSERITHGGSYATSLIMFRFNTYLADSPSNERPATGFRIAAVPEPTTLALLGVGSIGLIAYGWRRRKSK